MALVNYLRESDSMAIHRWYVANETRPRIAVDRREESWPSEIYFDGEEQQNFRSWIKINALETFDSRESREVREGERKDERKEEGKECLCSFLQTNGTRYRLIDGDRL